MTDTSFYCWQGTTLLLRLHVQPRASRDEVCGRHGERLKVRITAPPADGKANQHLRKFLARLFQVPISRVTLLHGSHSRSKQLAIDKPQQLPANIQRPTSQ